MNTALQDTLLLLFQQVTDDPQSMPAMPVHEWQEGSSEWQLLTDFHDMLERIQQRMQEALKSEEAQYRSIFEASSDSIFIADLNGFPVEANPAACKMFGYSYEEFIGLHPTTFIHPDYLHLQAGHVQATRAGEQYQSRGVVIRKDGALFLADAHTTPFLYKGKPHILAVVRDVTEQVQAEEQLREKEAQYRSIFEATTDALFIFDLESGLLVEVNPIACQVYGYSYEEFLALHPTTFIPSDSHSNLAQFIHAIKTGEQFHVRDMNVRKDGSTFPVEIHGTPFMYRGELHGLAVVRDITEQVRAEQELREKEAQYRGIFEASADGLLISDLEGEHIVEANPAICEMNGYTREELLVLPPANLITPEYHHLVAESIQAIKQGGQFYNLAVALRKDGTTFHAESRGTIFTYKGKPHILTISRDITERVQVQEQLREKEAEYRSVFEASTDGLVINDLEDGHLVEVNPAMYKMHGYTYEEFMALHPMTFIHPNSHSLFAEYLDTIKAGHLFHARATDVRKDGIPFPVEVHGTTFMYKGKPHVLAIVRDVTEQVRAEQELREKETQYRSIFEASTDGLIIADLDGYIVEANPATCRMFGYTYEEFVGLPATAITHPDRHHEIAESIQTIHTGHQQYYAQTIGVHKDGTQFYTEAHTTPFIYKGQPHLLGVVRDISERVRAEEQLREKEVQYRSIFEATTDGLVISDLEDGHTVEVNPTMCRMYGYTYEEFLALPPMATLHPDSHHLIEESIQAIKTTGEFHTQALVLHKDGTPFHIESHARTFMYQGKPHILSVARDVTEQVQAQQLLEHRVEERTRELSTLLEVSHNVASTIELKPLLGLVLDQLKVVADYTGSSFSIVEGEDLVLVDNRGPAPLEHVLQLHFPVKRMGLIWEMFCHQQPVIIADVHDDTPLAQAFQAWMSERMETSFSYITAWMGIPLTLKEQVIGMLTLSSQEPHYYTPQHARMALAIANQAAVAIENARLYEQAQALAALEERQRLARELHDSVSQALYGISLGAHTARTLLDRDPGRVAEPLDYVLSQAETALTEMRALIFELRPESLETEGLVAALSRQAAALQARHGIEVSTELSDEPDLSLKVKQELYRVAQEALHNTVKHAHAKKVEMHMHWSTEEFLLEIGDDGVGFDPASAFPGHLGLHSMRERVTRMGGVLQIESAPGQGTRLHLRLPASVQR